jgi:hypothetical protein
LNFLSFSSVFCRAKKAMHQGVEVRGEQKNLLHRFEPRTGAKILASRTGANAPISLGL